MVKQINYGFYDQPEQSFTALIPIRYTNIPIQMNSVERQIVTELKKIRNRENTIKQCRICLQNDQQKSKLIKACKCTGSIAHVHEHCLTQWIRRKILMNSNNKIQCEVCQIQFNYRMTTQKIIDCNQLKKHYRKQRRGLVCFAIIYCALFLFFIAMAVLSIIGKQSADIFLYDILKSSNGATLITSCLIIYFIGLIVVAVLFVSQYLVRQELIVDKVLRYREVKKWVKNYKIHMKR